jgi:hypothetical protein
VNPDAIFSFRRISKTRYLQVGHKGCSISGFPSEYKTGKNKGKGYVIFRRTSSYYNQRDLRFSHSIELAKNQIVTEIIFIPEHPQQSYGRFKNYGILIEFLEDFEQLTIWFFKGIQEAAPILFQRKLAGLIANVTRNDTLKLRYEISSSNL